MSFSAVSDQTAERQIKLELPKAFYEFLAPAPFKISWGGRGGAKSYSIAKLLVVKGYQDKKKILCAREYQNSLKESAKALIEEQIKELGLSWFYKITETDIIGLNGTEFIFKGLRLNIGSLNSIVGVDICWLEEAQFNTKASIDALLPSIRKAGSEIWVSMNPRKKDDVIYDMFLGGKPPAGSVIIKVNYYDNPWFYETTLPAQMEIMRERDPARFRHVWLGELDTRSDALVFQRWRTGILHPIDGQRPYYGCDWGFSNDPLALTKSYTFDDTNELYIAEEYVQHKVEVENLPEAFDKITGIRFGVITADSARPELISHMRRKNYRVHPSVKGKNSVIEGVEFLRSYDIIINPKCVHTINEFETYSYDIDTNGVILAALKMENDHCIDSVRYAIEETRRTQLKVSVRNIN
jgi:phage terminase large subunit